MNGRITSLAALLIVATSALADAAPIPATPVYTNKTRFRIPYRYDAAEMKSLGAKEIRLYVSRDRGGTWQQVQTVMPDAGKFNFQAPSDGEYWFVVKTVDGKNKLHPEGPAMEPGLQVIVDSTSPRLQLELRQPTPGKVQLAWTATDEHVDPTQLRLEYTQPGSPDWQMVSVVPKASGQTEWSVPQGGVVAVRGTVSDFAKNAAQDQTQIVIAPVDQTVPRPQTPDFRQPIAAPSPRANSNLTASIPSQFPTAPAAPNNPPAFDRGEFGDFQPMRTQPLPTTSISGPTTPRSSFAAHQPERDPANPAPITESQANTARYRIVNTRQFQVGYRLQDVGPSGVSSVELYITEDNGTTWYKYGDDPDSQSPVSVEVPRAGTFGFALGVRSGAGLASDPPQPGERPAIVVVVDQTPPRVELLPLEQGRGRSLHKILIQWKYVEEFPTERPIALSYSATGQGPWQPISGWQENTGNYVWNLGPGVPSRFYLRLEARDAAGNTSVVETPQPVLIDLSRPTAKIIDVESTGVLGPQ